MAAVPATAPGPPAPPGCEMRHSKTKGFGLYACAPCPAGQQVFPDEPLFVMQHTGNRRVVAACAKCCRFIGSLQTQLEVVFNEPRFAPLLAGISDSVRAWEVDLAARGATAVAGIRCSQGCGEMYCSEACRDAHFQHSHNLLCTGPITQEDHPLIQFKYHAIEHSDTLLLLAQVISHLINRAKAAGGGAAATQGLMAELLGFCHAPFRDACRPPPGRGKDAEFYSHADALVNKGAMLLKQALEIHAPVEVGAIFESGAAFFSEVLGMFEYNNIDVEVPTPIGNLFFERASTLAAAAQAGNAAAATELQVLEKILREKEWVMRCVWGEETTGNFAADGLANPEDTTDGDAAMASENVQVDAEGYNPVVARTAMTEAQLAVDKMTLEELIMAPWPSLHGTALYASVARINHSCDPNTKIEFPFNSACLQAVALKQINPGEEISISYIRQDVDVKYRKQQLLEYGFVCNCERCLREDSGEVRKANKRLK